MKLSAKQFAELAASFASDNSCGDNERRRAGRVGLQAQIKLSLISDGQRLPSALVNLIDFSPRGLAFHYHQPLSAGQQFIIELPRESGQSIPILCTVVHCAALENTAPASGSPLADYKVGAELTCALRQSELHHPAAPRANPEMLKRIQASVLE